ncbi:substrate-binding domain-containing protein [Rhizobium sp. 2YAF20]|uniref:substrate-binding domain-containing protein n=1 Tax=Rhizobium sp. 2YAF20 TaxID=3233027 RepID=UPI003F9957F2
MLLAGAGWASAQNDRPFAQIDVAPKRVGSAADLQSMDKFCGTKKIRVAYSDGFGGNTWRKISRAELEDEASKCPNITEVAYVDAQGNPQKQISDIQSLAAQGYDVIIIFADSGEAVLRATKEATQAGIAVVLWQSGVDFPGTPGVDYLVNVTASQSDMGGVWMKWIAQRLNGKGNVLVYGGTPGAPQTAGQKAGLEKVAKEYPDLRILEDPIVTNWDPAQYQKLTPALLAKYPQIDAIYSDYGNGVMGALRAFKEAGRPIPIVTSQAANELSCFWKKEKANEPQFQIGTESAFNWIIRVALRKGVAAAEGLNNTEPSIIMPTIVEDSTDTKMQPVCSSDLPPDIAAVSTQLSKDQLNKLLAK